MQTLPHQPPRRQATRCLELQGCHKESRASWKGGGRVLREAAQGHQRSWREQLRGPRRRALLPQAGSVGASTWLPAPRHFRGSWAENPSEPGSGRTGRTPSFQGPAPDGIWSAGLFMVKDTGKCRPRVTQICYNSPTEMFARWPLLALPAVLRAPATSSSCSGAASGTNTELLCP